MVDCMRILAVECLKCRRKTCYSRNLLHPPRNLLRCRRRPGVELFPDYRNCKWCHRTSHHHRGKKTITTTTKSFRTQKLSNLSRNWHRARLLEASFVGRKIIPQSTTKSCLHLTTTLRRRRIERFRGFFTFRSTIVVYRMIWRKASNNGKRLCRIIPSSSTTTKPSNDSWAPNTIATHNCGTLRNTFQSFETICDVSNLKVLCSSIYGGCLLCGRMGECTRISTTCPVRSSTHTPFETEIPSSLFRIVKSAPPSGYLPWPETILLRYSRSKTSAGGF